MDIYVVYTESYSEPPHMHSMHTTRELAEMARLMMLHQEKLYWEKSGEDYNPMYASEISIRKEQLITSYKDLGQMFKERYVWDGPMEGE